MADDNYILITARLDKGTSIGGIQDDLNKIANKVLLQLQRVEISQDGTNSLQQSLNKIQKNLSLNISGVSIDQTQAVKQAQQISQRITSAMNINSGSGVSRAFDISDSVANSLKKRFTDASVLADTLQNKFKSVGSVTTEVLGHENKLIDQFRVTVTNADGAVEKLVYSLKQIEGTKKHAWEVVSATSSDNNIKLQEQLEKQTIKASDASLRLSNNLEGVKQKFAEIAQVHNGDANIANYLDNAVKAINALNGADSSNFNKLKINAENAIREYTNYLNKLQTADTQNIRLQEQLEKQIAKSSNASLKLSNNLEGAKKKLSEVLQNHGNDANITRYLENAVQAINALNKADGSNFDRLKINAENAIREYTNYLNKLQTADAQNIRLQEQLEKQIAKSSNTSLKLTNNLEGVKRKLSDVLQAHGSDTNITTYLNQAVDAITKLNSADGKNFDKLKINAEDAIRRYTDYLNSLKAADAKAEQAQRKLSSEIERSYKHLAHYVQIMDNLSERQIFNKNASNVGVVGLQDDIKTADELFKALKKDFESGKISPAMLDDIKTLNSRVTDVIANAHEMARTLGQSQTNVVHEEEVNYLKALYNNLKASDVALDEFKADYQELNALLSQAQTTGDYTQYFTQLDIFKSKFSEAKTEIKATTAATSELEKMSKSLASNKMNTFFDKNAGNVQVNALKTEISGLINEWATLKTEIDNTGRVTHTMQTRLDDLKTRMQNATSAADMLQANIKHIADTQRLATQQQSLDTRISSWLQNNTRASAETIASLKNLQAQVHDADAQTMFNLNNQFRQITANARAAGEAGLKLSDIIKQKLGKFAGWFSIATVVMRGVNKLKEMYRTVVELNTAMVGLRKVTDETDAVYDKFFTDAAKNAKILGASIKDIIDSTTEFARLGYSLADSQLLAQMATLYKNVGDGIDIGQATSNLISTMKAFGLSANEVESIIDKFNKVGEILLPLRNYIG